MTGAELKALQERRGWSNTNLIEILADALGHRYTPGSITRWRSDKQKLPRRVDAFLSALEAPAGPSPGGEGGQDDSLTGDPDLDALLAEAEDSAPAGRGQEERPRPELVLVTGAPGAYAKICEEFFEIVATGVGMVGAAVGSESVRRDGQIIFEDKAELGKAWGKLAEQNETFRKVLTATEKQGAYLAVALATGTTAGRIWRNHQPPPAPVEALRSKVGPYEFTRQPDDGNREPAPEQPPAV